MRKGREMAKICDICGKEILTGRGYTKHGKTICKMCMDEIYEESNGKNKHTSKKRRKTAKRVIDE
jgi:hypothetical protein